MQTKRLLTLVAAAATTAMLGHGPVTLAVAVDAPASVPAALNEGSNRWFVELSGAPLAEGGKGASLRREQAAVRALAREAGVAMKERFVYETLWNGFSVDMSAADAPRLKGIPGVRAVYPVVEVAAPPRPANDGVAPDMFSAITQTGVDKARSELGLTGKGIKVGIIDTGIDYDHPDLGGAFGPGNKVAYGWDFVGDAFNADPNSPTYNPVPAPDPDPDDCGGHGTHVAGITGAKAAGPNGVTGVAPDVTLGAYRVFGCAGSTTSDIIVAALERAYKDGMDVVNMSLGAAFQWPEYPSAVVSNRLVKKGVVVVASAGNNGASGTFSLGAPGAGRDVIAVASYDNVQVALAAFTISPDNTKIGYGPATAAPLPPTSGTLPVARTGTVTTTDDGCNPIASDLSGQAVLIRRGTCPFYQKAFNAQVAGAAAVILYNNAAGRINPTVAGTPAITIPVVAISDTEGVLINSRLDAGAVDMTWTEELLTSPNPTGNLMSSFSSYGLSPDLTLKPDVGGPGGSIYSTYPIESGAYATLSGTSMSAPHVAGTVALLLEALPDTPAPAVRAILQNTAEPKLWFGNPGLGFLEPAHRQGAGMVQIDRAVTSTVRVTPGKLSLGESEAGPQARRLTVSNSGAEAVTLSLSYVNTLSTSRATAQFDGAANVVGWFLSDAAVAFAAPTVTVPAGGSATVDLMVDPATGPAGSMYGGYVVLTPAAGLPYQVPFAGYVGDYQSINPLSRNQFGFPWLAQLDGGFFNNRSDGATYTMQGDDIPFFLVHFDHPVRRVEFEIVNARNDRRIHPVFSNIYDFDYLGRNSHRSTFFAFDWDGTRSHSNGRGNELTKFVPNGQYKVNVRALKANGDAGNPDHWEVWTSPVVTIARP
jgi:minor extracellular serine protease Vpr